MDRQRNIVFFGSKPVLFILLGILLLSFVYFIFQKSVIGMVMVAAAPLIVYLVIRLLEYPLLSFFCVIVMNYFIMGLTRYVPGLQGGVVMDVLLFFTLFSLLLRSRDHSVDWSGARNPLTVLTGIWFLYCIFLVFNPVGDQKNWVAGVRGLAVYIFLFPLFTAILLNRYKYLKIFLFIWSILTLLAVIKALIQKFIGFDSVENYWLFVEGARRTHVIYSGVRYFSFFTDAASFGTSMGLSMVVFAIVGLYAQNTPLRIYYWLVALLACYAMFISGTRAAIAVPFVGFAFFVFLSKQWKVIIPGILLILCVFVFFRYTYIGHGNAEIRRMRTAFNPTEDASFLVRKANQAKMWDFMKDHPFGIGVGMAKRAEPGDYMYQLPTDTSLVYIWVETGTVGLVFFLLIYLMVLGRGLYDVWFRIRNQHLKALLSALLAGLVGMLVSAYGNETLLQFPNGPIVYAMMAFVFLGRKYDNEISDERES